jgi:hypothetical protein
VIKMLVENAAPEPEAPRDAPTTAEVAACLEASVPPFIQRLMYDHARGRLDDQGRPTGKPTKQKAKPAPEPDLAEDRPLAAAAARLRAQEATAPEPEFAGDTAEERQVVRAAEALDRLAAAKEAWDAHPWEDRAHRSECRRCRETWRREALA